MIIQVMTFTSRMQFRVAYESFNYPSENHICTIKQLNVNVSYPTSFVVSLLTRQLMLAMNKTEYSCGRLMCSLVQKCQ